MVSGKLCTYPSLRLGLQSKLRYGLSSGLWEGRVRAVPETWIDPKLLFGQTL